MKTGTAYAKFSRPWVNQAAALFSTVFWVAFEYGPTTNYGQIISSPTVPGSISSTATLPVTGLLPGRLYHCRLVASTTLGVMNGNDLTFTTLPPEQPTLRNQTLTYAGAMYFNAVGTVGTGYQVWASTNLTNWVSLGTATEISPGNYEFIDAASTNYPVRFYQMRWNSSQ